MRTRSPATLSSRYDDDVTRPLHIFRMMLSTCCYLSFILHGFDYIGKQPVACESRRQTNDEFKTKGYTNISTCTVYTPKTKQEE